MPNYLDTLIGKINDSAVRDAIRSEVNRLRTNRDFGLIFERHLPETVRLYDEPVRRGSKVQIRDADDDTVYVVTKVDAGVAELRTRGAQLVEPQPTESLVVIREFGDVIYPGFAPLGRVSRAEATTPAHLALNAENYHALEALRYAFDQRVDCIYIDPPYNTGARDWKYNNDYVDDNDAYRHSKWLSFMERRLLIARDLLRADGVLIATVGEDEIHHLGVLLEQVFPDCLRQVVTIVINPGGAAGAGLSRVEEYAFFCFLGDATPALTDDDMLVADAHADVVHTGAEGVRWEWLMRGGNAWYRESRPNLCYPILLSRDGTRIERAGPPLQGPEEERPKVIDGLPVAWPVRRDGRLGIWRVDSARLNFLADRGYAYVSRRDDARDTWTIKYLMAGTLDAIDAGHVSVTGRDPATGRATVQVNQRRRKVARTVWYRGRHIAGGSGGTQLLSALLGERNAFPFPKSLYAVKDCLSIAVGDRPDAIVLDFFAGSGTTLHATALLNAEDGGQRQCVIVTNNEVDEETARRLRSEGATPGDQAFASQGIFERVTRRRCDAAISGSRPDETPVPGEYLDGRPYADGFQQNVEYFRLDYLDRDGVNLGRAFQAIAPLLWMRAGAVGPRVDHLTADGWSLPNQGRYGVCFDVEQWRPFVDAVHKATGVTDAFVVTDSISVFQQVAAELPAWVRPTMLYEDYLSTFEINTGGAR